MVRGVSWGPQLGYHDAERVNSLVVDFLVRSERARAVDSRPAGISTNIRCITAREAGTSRHHRGPIKSPTEVPRTSLQYGTEGFEEVCH